MFETDVYIRRRRVLLEKMADTAAEGKRGIALFIGNADAPQNYRGNDCRFRR